jgi:hypothetical protein
MAEVRFEIPDALHQELQARHPRVDVAQVCMEALSRVAGAGASRVIVDDMVRMFNPHRRGT